jgi:hypothetical protein
MSRRERLSFTAGGWESGVSSFASCPDCVNHRKNASHQLNKRSKCRKIELRHQALLVASSESWLAFVSAKRPCSRLPWLNSKLVARLTQQQIGQHLYLSNGASFENDPIYTVVGVGANVKNGGLASGKEPEYCRLRRHQSQVWD